MWFKVDDSFYDHPKAVGLSNDSLATWTRAGSWCGRHLTDGVMADPHMFVGDATNPVAVIEDLIDRNLWELPEQDSHVQFHDWAQWNPTRAEVLAKRKKDADRRRDWLVRATAARHGVSHDVSHGVSSSVSHGVSHGVSTPTSDDAADPDQDHGVSHGVHHAAPDPTRPEGESRVGVGAKGSDRNAPARTASGAGATWTPHDVVDTPPAAKRRGGPVTTHTTVAEVVAEARHPYGPSPDPEARAAEARAQLMTRQRQLATPDTPDPTGGGLHGEALAAAQLAERRRHPDLTVQPPLPDEPDDEVVDVEIVDDDPPLDDDPGPADNQPDEPYDVPF